MHNPNVSRYKRGLPISEKIEEFNPKQINEPQDLQLKLHNEKTLLNSLTLRIKTFPYWCKNACSIPSADALGVKNLAPNAENLNFHGLFTADPPPLAPFLLIPITSKQPNQPWSLSKEIRSLSLNKRSKVLPSHRPGANEGYNPI